MLDHTWCSQLEGKVNRCFLSFVLDLTLLKVEKPLTNLFLTATQIRVNTNKYNAIKRLHNQGFTSCFLVACLGRFQSSKIQIELSQHHQHRNLPSSLLLEGPYRKKKTTFQNPSTNQLVCTYQSTICLCNTTTLMLQQLFPSFLFWHQSTNIIVVVEWLCINQLPNRLLS